MCFCFVHCLLECFWCCWFLSILGFVLVSVCFEDIVFLVILVFYWLHVGSMLFLISVLVFCFCFCFLCFLFQDVPMLFACVVFLVSKCKRRFLVLVLWLFFVFWGNCVISNVCYPSKATLQKRETQKTNDTLKMQLVQLFSQIMFCSLGVSLKFIAESTLKTVFTAKMLKFVQGCVQFGPSMSRNMLGPFVNTIFGSFF